MLSSFLYSLVASPSSVIATIILLVAAFEASYLLRVAKRRLWGGQKDADDTSSDGSTTRRKATPASNSLPCLDFNDLETPVEPHITPLTSLPPFTTVPTETVALNPLGSASKVSLLPLEGSLDLDKEISKKFARVPMQRLSSAEQRLGTAIQAAMGVIRAAVSGPRRRPKAPGGVDALEVIRKLRAGTSKPNTYGCASKLGGKIVLVESHDSHPRHLPMPLPSNDRQTKELIGFARKVSHRCADCTRPLTAPSTSMLCERCDAASKAKVSTANSDEKGWEFAKTRRRRTKSDKQSRKTSKTSRGGRRSGRGRNQKAKGAAGSTSNTPTNKRRRRPTQRAVVG
ncbi:hypothetical protein AAMO2058_001239500 [Amorphochlora amoebiformis]